MEKKTITAADMKTMCERMNEMNVPTKERVITFVTGHHFNGRSLRQMYDYFKGRDVVRNLKTRRRHAPIY